MEIFVRDVTLADARAIAELSKQLGYPVSSSSTVKNIEAISNFPDEIIRVAVAGEKVVGWIHVFHTTRLESAQFCEIGGLVIHDQYRNMGIGKLLVNSIKSWCKSTGAKTLRVRSNVKRNEAHLFYVRLGFEEVKQQRVFEARLDKDG